MNLVEKSTYRSELVLWKKSVGNHVISFFSGFRELVSIWFACFCTLWTIFEACRSLEIVLTNRIVSLVWLAVASSFVSLGARWYTYLSEFPEGIESLEPTTRRIAHLAQKRWQFKFAKSALAQLIAPIDREWRALREGKAVTIAKPALSTDEYYQSLLARPENVMRMIEVSKKLMVVSLQEAIHPKTSRPPIPKLILEELENIAQVYRASVEFEKEWLSIIPPENFEKIHELGLGFSEPIRDGIHQLFQYFQLVCEHKSGCLEFTLNFKTLPIFEEFERELDRLVKLQG